MTGTAFYILLSRMKCIDGYNVMQYVKELTRGEIEIGQGIMYGILSKME